MTTNTCKRVMDQIWTSHSRHLTHPSPSFFFRRSVHANVYDKNPDDLVQHSFVHDEVMEPQSDKYWAPHPKTGIFRPAAHNILGSMPTNIGKDSGLELKVWFRTTSLEDIDKPM